MRKQLMMMVLLLSAAAACGPGKAPESKPAPAPAPEPVARPAPHDEIQVEGTLGTISDDAVAAAFRARWDDVGRCFAVENQRLRWLGGKVLLSLRVGADGAPTSVHVKESVGNLAVDRCVAEVARGLKFPRPQGGKEAEAAFPIEFRGTAPVGDWDEARVQSARARARKDATACHKGTPLARGLAVTIFVGPGGRVMSAGVAAEEPVDHAVAMCLVERARGWRLEDPLGRVTRATVRVETR